MKIGDDFSVVAAEILRTIDRPSRVPLSALVCSECVVEWYLSFISEWPYISPHSLCGSTYLLGDFPVWSPERERRLAS